MDRRGFLAALGAAALGGCLGGGVDGAGEAVAQTPTPTETGTPTASPTDSPTPTPTPAATATSTPTPTATATATPTPTPTGTTTATPTPTPAGNRAPPIVFEGDRDRNTGAFEVTGRGPDRLSLAYDGTSTFSVWLLDGDAEPLEVLANAAGPHRARLLRGLDPGRYRFTVEAEGAWRVRLDQRRPPADGAGLPIRRAGEGSVPVGPVAFEDGTWLSLSATDPGRYAVWLRNEVGEPVERLIDARGPFEDRTTAFNATGPGYLAVEAAGGWSLSAGSV